jgi:hypothetical protein
VGDIGSVGLIGHSEPIPGHMQKENPAFQTANLLCQLNAISGIEPIASRHLATG